VRRAGAARLYAACATHEDVAQDRVVEGPEAIGQGLERFFAAFPDARWAAEHVLANGDRATASYRLTGTLRGQLGPFEPAGQRLALRGVHVVQTAADGSIASSADYWDGAELARQMRGADADAPRHETKPLPDVGLPAVAPEGFRRAMRLLAGGVAVVTTVVENRPWGLTVSACCSLTADPPQVLVSLHSRTTSCQAILQSGLFGVDLLGSNQVDVARICSAAGQPKFIDELVDPASERARSPVIAGALGHLDCKLTDAHGVGDHLLLIGLVQETLSPRIHEEIAPLVYYERAFRTTGAALA
jgi:flavin reductase (DIM6/NTAB) family NADH-FMN oxidoreductase RutF/predicted ester cyclase